MVNASLDWVECNSNNTQNTVITYSHYGNTAAASMDFVANPISPGSLSFEKWHRLMVTLNDATKVSDLKFWVGGTQPDECTIMTTASEGDITNLTLTSWRTPAATNGLVEYAADTATPSAANFGIAGSTTASIVQGAAGTNSTGISDFWVHYVKTTASATEGPSTALMLHVSFDEVR